MRADVVGVVACGLVFGALLAGCGGGGGGEIGTAPSVTVDAPYQDVEIGLGNGGVVRVTYRDDYPAGVATTRILADQDGDPSTTGDQVAITQGRPEQDGTAQTVDWDVSGAPPGSYKILAVTSAATGQAVGVAPGEAHLNASPVFTFVAPTTDQEVPLASEVQIRYVTDDDDDAALCLLWLDRDGDPDTIDDATDLTRWFPDANGATETHVWDSVGYEPVAYTVFGMIWDGTNPPVVAEAPGTITLRPSVWQIEGYSGSYAEGVDTFPDGSCVVVGNFSSVATFGAGETYETTLVSNGGTDVFVARYDASGRLMWATRAGGVYADYAEDVAVLSDGSCLVAGTFKDETTFGAGEPTEATLDSAGQVDVFVAKFNTAGKLVWVKTAGGEGSEFVYDLSTGPSGSFAITGYYHYSQPVFGAGETNQKTLPESSDSTNMLYVAVYAADGTLSWATSENGSSDTSGRAVAHNGTYWYVAGVFYDTLTFGTGGLGKVLTSAGSADVFVAVYNSIGYVLYATRAGGIGSDYPVAITVHPTEYSVTVAGSFSGSAQFPYSPFSPSPYTVTSEGGTDVFLVKYNTSLYRQWVTADGGTGGDYVRGMASCADGSNVLTGYYYGGAPEFGSTQLPSAADFGGEWQGFLARYTEHGAHSWAKAQIGASVWPQDVAVARGDDSCRVAGQYKYGMTVLEGEVGETTIGTDLDYTTSSSERLFVASYGSDGGAR